jgi:hypothetical protein
MEDDVFERYQSAYNEGIMFAAQMVASRIIRMMNNGEIKMLPADKTVAIAKVKLSVEYFLAERKIIPTSYEVMRGKAEQVELDFNMKD